MHVTRPVAILALVLALAAAQSAASPEPALAGPPPPDLFELAVDAAGLAYLHAGGYDIVDIAHAPSSPSLPSSPSSPSSHLVRAILSPAEAADLAASGLAPALWRDAEGRTLRQVAADQAEDGYDIWRSFDEPGGFREQIEGAARDYPELVQLVTLGTTYQGRPILALRVTAGAPSTPEGSRPAVLLSALQHAREWISSEVARRLLFHLLEGYGDDPEITAMVDSREIWFLPVANPDGYQHTFTEDARFWRRNLRDNDGDGTVSDGDGVDPNRNFPAHWGYDDEGSSPDPSGDTYRGPAPGSEPETRAMMALLDRASFAFQLNFHSVGPLLLYGIGWQEKTHAADEPIMLALAGTDADPAIPGTDPGLSADLYITNGETCDYAYAEHGVICMTPELSDGGSGGGFVFPDDEAQVQAELEAVLPLTLDMIRSAADPTHPVSHLGRTVQPMVADAFAVSYGDPQPVQAVVARDLGDVTLRWTVDGGPEQSAPTTEWQGGERYGDIGDVYYRRVRGSVVGARPGSTVRVRFTTADAVTEPFTYTMASDTGNPVLIVAAEDYTGDRPSPGPAHLAPHVQALAAAGIAADVYDIDARGRVAPDALGVLSHYRAVVWYTGDDIVPRDAGGGPGEAATWANDLAMAMRDYLNEGGRLLHAGKYAGLPSFQGLAFDAVPEDGEPCDSAPGGCAYLYDDFYQYYLGAHQAIRTDPVPFDTDNYAGTGSGLWSDAGDDLQHAVTRTFAAGEIGEGAILSFASLWRMERDYDYGYVELSGDGGQTWTTLEDMDGHLTDANPNGGNMGWGLTGSGTARLRFDLSPHAAITGTALLRLRYATDGSVAGAGWWIDDVALDDATGNRWTDDLEQPWGTWRMAGWQVVPIPRSAVVGLAPASGTAAPFDGLSWSFAQAMPGVADHGHTFLPTSALYPPAEHPDFLSHTAAAFADPRRSAHTGEHFVWSGLGPGGHQRLTRVVDLTEASAAELRFWTSYQVNDPWHAVFVEARTAGEEGWTTLLDTSGHTRPEAALSCSADFWFPLVPFLSHYMAVEGEGEEARCVPNGSTGAWHAATGDSGGWQEWVVDLSGWSHWRVEVSIAYISPFGSFINDPGVMIDDASIVVDGVAETTSFEDDLAGWEPGSPPSPSGPPPPFFRASLADWPFGAAVVTDDTILLGFGLEDVVPAEAREALVARAMGWLLRPESRVFVPAAEG